jgi:decaprenylphospho-beta-D-ribofuranose 2-oxidase
MKAIETISGWGGWPRRTCRISVPVDPFHVADALTGASAIARGLGRAYGDSALNPDCTVLTRRLDRLLAFDAESGALVAESGVSLARMIEVLLPRGFFLPVVPGTKFVTFGGAIASDVHGKNHHVAGSFGNHILWLDLLTVDGDVRRCSPGSDVSLFQATLGGMGLTGIVLRAAIRLLPIESGWIRQRTIVAPDLNTAIDVFEANLASTYSVAWIDCLARGPARGRSLVYLGEHASQADLPPDIAAHPFATARRSARRFPAYAPSWIMNQWSVRAFNHAYFQKGCRQPSDRLIDWDRYFFPLDSILEWNRIYGRPGFAQYQCALPLVAARDALTDILDVTASSGLGSFLSVLKRFGPGVSDRPLSFPIEGYTLALDFSLSPAALTMMDRLDEITIAAGGRIYLAKDSRMTQRTFEAGYGTGRAALSAAILRSASNRSFASLQSRRLGI